MCVLVAPTRLPDKRGGPEQAARKSSLLKKAFLEKEAFRTPTRLPSKRGATEEPQRSPRAPQSSKCSLLNKTLIEKEAFRAPTPAPGKEGGGPEQLENAHF